MSPTLAEHLFNDKLNKALIEVVAGIKKSQMIE
jgi:hypothetical protein